MSESTPHAGFWIRVTANAVDLLSNACVGLGYFWIAIDPRTQGWHDKIVRTLVVRRA